jgi:large subunit ribosomal protein L25
MEQVTREITIEALPNEIPESIVHDVSGMVMNDVVFVSALSAPQGVTIVDVTPDETVVATLTPPRLSVEAEDEIETETERVGDGAAPAAAEASAGGDDSGDSGESASE